MKLEDEYKKWVVKHPCPKCGAEAMDFTINCNSPYICVSCHTHFGFVEKESEPFGRENE